jgi:hypothetical protein
MSVMTLCVVLFSGAASKVVVAGSSLKRSPEQHFSHWLCLKPDDTCYKKDGMIFHANLVI